jgi:hypothetical protein
MFSLFKRSSCVLSLLLLLPSAAYAQAAITGVVKDTSGAVLPGVTVEAASPVLIEKVRSVVSDSTGQYRIVNLRPGTYTVTFSLPGFSSVKRDGIELSGSFVATVNGDLKVGALEETITVTGETPIVDVQSAKVQRTVSKDIISSIPTSRNADGIQALIPGMSTTSDAGGISGGTGGSAGAIHGGRGNDSRTYNDGLNTGWAGANGGGGNMANVAGSQEVVLSTSGGLGEAETSGVVLNVIPRDGANTFSGTVIGSGAKGGMQGDNYTPALQAAGLKTPSQLVNVYDINPMGGGRIVRDKLWFYLTYREWGATNTVPGMFVNVNAGNPAKQFTYPVQFDTTQQAFTDSKNRNGIGRITWQATPRNKINLHWSEQYNSANTKGGGTATQTIEASGRTLFQPSHIQQASWSSPVTNRLLLEAGFGTYQSRYSVGYPRVDGTFNPGMIRVVEQAGSIPGLAYNNTVQSPIGYIGTHEWRASASYVTGAHNMKFGYQGGFDNPSQRYQYVNTVIAYQFKNGIPNQLTEVIASPGSVTYVRNLLPANFYAQDQWTSNRLTLQGGLRYDHILTSYPYSAVGGPGYAIMPVPIVYPSRSTPGIHWSDVTPRVGLAYDLFGNGKTALKMNLGKYMEAFSATNTDLDLNPLIRTALSTTRSWTDSNVDFVPNCDLANINKNGECGAMANQSLGQPVFVRSYDPAFINGWGKRAYNWEFGLTLQQQVLPRVSVSAGYERRWFGNQYVVANQIGVATTTGASNAANYTAFSITTPADSRLPGGGGQVIGGLYDINPNLVGQVNEVAQLSTNFAKEIENWQGFDFGVNARLSALTIQAGTSTGRRLADECAVRALVPELGAGVDGQPNSSIAGSTVNNNNNFALNPRSGLFQSVTNPYCRVVEPYLTSLRGLATYTIPRVGIQVSTTFQSNPGPPEAALYAVPNSAVVGSLNRNLSGNVQNVTVNLVTPGSMYGARINQLDFRVAKILRFNKDRLQVGLDIFNLTNTDTPLSYNNNFVPGGAWLTPSTITPARYAKVNAQFDF